MPLLLSAFFPTGQVDLDLLRCQQLKLYILKAGRALLSHQDQLRQILSQPAVQEAAAAHTGIFLRSSCGSVRKAYSSRKQARDVKGRIQMASASTRKMCNLAKTDENLRGLGGEGGKQCSLAPVYEMWPEDQ